MTYQDFKNQWDGKRVDFDHEFGYQCVDEIMQFIFEVTGSAAGIYGNAINFATNPSPAFLNKVIKVTDGSKQPGDIIVMISPASPDGHIALRDTNLDEMLEQNGADGNGSGVGRDAIGVYRAIPYAHVVAVYRLREFIVPPAAPPAPAEGHTPVNEGRVLNLPANIATWRIYHVGGPWTSNPDTSIAKLAPAEFGGLSYDIVGNPAQDIYIINTQMFGQVAIWGGSPATITDAAAPAAPEVPVVPAPPATPPPLPPAAPEPPKPANTEYTKLGQPMDLVINKDTQKWNLGFANDTQAQSVEALAKGVAFRAFGRAQRTDGDKPAYFMTEEDFGNADQSGTPNNNVGVNTVDLSPAPAPESATAPAPNVTSTVNTGTLTGTTSTTFVTGSATNGDKVNVTVGGWQGTYQGFLSPQRYLANANVKVFEIDTDLPQGHDHPEVQQLVKGQTVTVAGTFSRNGVQYYRTVASVTKGYWYGVPVISLTKIGDTPVDELDEILADIGEESKLAEAERAVGHSVEGILGRVFKKKKQ